VNTASVTANATFCATLVDQWHVNGLTSAFVAPGSRSTPLALALVEHDDIAVHVFHDERSAAFAALGHGLATATPAVVLCSSGTAGAHFYAAVIEAEASMVPMIVCTADRPPELWGRGAPQTIDQTNYYGSKVRDFVEPGPPDDQQLATWRPLANRLWAGATGLRPGPVHANLSFRDPLTGTAGELPPSIPAVEPAAEPASDGALVSQVAARLVGKRGVLIVGRHESAAADIVALADQLQWPILCDHRSACRTSSSALQHFDALLRVPEFADAHVPDVVLRVGEIVSSKSTSQWLARCGADVIASRPHGRNIDPEAIAQVQFDEKGFVPRLLVDLAASDAAGCDPSWRAEWLAADHVAQQAIAQTTNEFRSRGEVSFVHQVVESARPGTHLVVSSSMPVRDVEWFAAGAEDLTVLSNRGANGIDGVIATAIGVALTGVPTRCIIGDVAFLHDSSSLVALRDRAVDLAIFVIDNDGGGIFSFLPQHDLLSPDVFEQLFGTPHGTDLPALAAAHGIETTIWEAPYAPDDSLIAAVLAGTGARIVLTRTDRSSNLADHDALNQSVARALTAS